MSQPSQPQYSRPGQPQYGYDGGYTQQGPPPQQGPGRYYTPGPNGAPLGKIHPLASKTSYLPRQNLALQSHSTHLIMGRNHLHMPVRHRLLSSNSNNNSIQLRILATGYHQALSGRHHRIPTPIDHNPRTTTRKNYPHPPTQAPPTLDRRHTHLISNRGSPRASIHHLSTRPRMVSRMVKGSNLKEGTATNRLLTLIPQEGLPLHRSITQGTTKHHLHKHLLKHHLPVWARIHIRCSTRDRLQAGTRHITPRRRNSSRETVLKRRAIRMISIGNG